MKYNSVLGKLDQVIAKAEVDIAANRVKKLDEVLNSTWLLGRVCTARSDYFSNRS